MRWCTILDITTSYLLTVTVAWITIWDSNCFVRIEFLLKMLLPTLYEGSLTTHSSLISLFLIGLNLFYVLMGNRKGTHLWKFPKADECELWFISNYWNISKSNLMKLSYNSLIAFLLLTIRIFIVSCEAPFSKTFKVLVVTEVTFLNLLLLNN